jgi:hypothetical protein
VRHIIEQLLGCHGGFSAREVDMVARTCQNNLWVFHRPKIEKWDFHASFSFSQRNCGFHKHNFRFGVKQRVDISWDLLQESDVPIGGMTHPH